MKTPKLTLVGAGPGDPDLITVKGAKVLAEADVVLYDALSNKKLLDYCSDTVEKIYVGKRGGFSQTQQDDINQLIIDKALQGNHVVRLKGGDPFVFGRGHEELIQAINARISVQVVPGISSCIALPELLGIPLTKRNITESFWVTTGVTRNETVSDDIRAAAQTNTTVVILMGMKNLPEIIAIFKKAGKEELPIAIIQNGSLPEEKIGIGTMANILTVVEQKQLAAPALIVIGNVVKLYDND